MEQSPVDTISVFFYADWCKPCQRVKPLYFNKVQPMYVMNGITTYEYNYDAEGTKDLMKKFGVNTIPKLCVIDLKKAGYNPIDTQDNMILRITKMDSHKIEEDWDKPMLKFSVEEDF